MVEYSLIAISKDVVDLDRELECKANEIRHQIILLASKINNTDIPDKYKKANLIYAKAKELFNADKIPTEINISDTFIGFEIILNKHQFLIIKEVEHERI